MFWERFYELCESKNKKPAQIVKELNLANGLITKWKNGFMPNSIALLAIAEYFDVSIDYLLGRTNVKKIKDTKDYTDILFENNGELKLKLFFMKYNGDSEERANSLIQIFKLHKKAIEENISYEEVFHREVKGFRLLTKEEMDKIQEKEQFERNHPEIRINRIIELEKELEKLENEEK